MKYERAAALMSRVLRPQRAHEPQVREAIRGARSVREAHERLIARGVVSERWLSELGVFFGANRCGCVTNAGWVHPKYEACAKCSGTGLSPAELPRRLSQLIVLASQPEQALAAVALARDFRARAALWGTAVGPSIGWMEFDPFCLALAGPTFAAPTLAMPAFSFATNARALDPALRAAIDGYRQRRNVTVHEQFPVLNQLRCDLISHELHRDACARALSVAGLVRERSREFSAQKLGEMLATARAVLDRPVASLPDLSEPLLALWELGYAPLLANQQGFVLGTAPERMRAWRRRGLDPRG